MQTDEFTALVKQFLLACREGKAIVSEMPPLPPGLTPRHVRVTDILHQKIEEQEMVRISDVADAMGVTRPSVTRLIGQLTEKGYLRKETSSADHRVVTVAFTEKGEQFYQKYVSRYFQWVTRRLQGMDPGDLRTAVRVLDQARKALADNTDFEAETDPGAER